MTLPLKCPTTDPNLCPTGCGRRRRHGHLMCARCWREVPKAVQDNVQRSWRALSRDMTDDTMRAYVLAREDALASIA